MTIKQQGGVFGRNPTFNDVQAKDITASGSVFAKALGVNTTALTAASGFGFASLSGSNGGGIVLQQNGTPKVSIASFGNDQYIDAVGKTVIRTGATVTGAPVNVMEFQTDRNVKMSAGNLIFINGAGIDFSATAGTGTSELFDDYEEGTWTPVPADAETGGNTGTAGTATGYYTKVGNVVHVMGALVNVSTSGLTAGNLFYIQGLPFASKDLAGATAYYLSGGALTSSVSITGNVQFYLNDLSKTSVTFFDAGGSILVSDLTSGAADFYFSLTYMAA